MKVVVVSSRFPWPPFTGDRLRTVIWIDALRDHCELTIVSPPGDVEPSYRGVRWFHARYQPLGLLRGGIRAMAEGLPLHTLMAAPYDWKGALAGAGDQDVAIILLSRAEPWIRPHIRARRVVLDAIDSLALSASARSQSSRGPARWAWNMEARRMTRLERDMSARYDSVVVVNPDEAGIFGLKTSTVPVGVDVRPLDVQQRDFDFGFWGRLGYFANSDAALRLLQEVWPRIRAMKPSASLLVAGADAPRKLRTFHGRDGVTVVSPVADLRSMVRRVKIALFPIRFGTGHSIKVLEAAEAGCAIVATPEALRGLDHLAAASALVSPAEMADRAVRLLDDPAEWARMSRVAREVVAKYYSREQVHHRLRDLVLRGATQVDSTAL